MTTRVVLQHLAGSKINQIEQFPLDGLTEITFGRDATNTVAFDAQRDDACSRQHAVLRVGGTPEKQEFQLTDLGSSNGTFVNGTRLSGAQELSPGDVIEFGGGGPKIAFDVQPRPAHLLPRTRVMQVPRDTAATRMTPMTRPTPAPTAPAATRTGVGRETVQRMLSEERRSSSRTWMVVVGGVLLLATAGGVAFTLNANRQVAALRAENAAKLEAIKQAHDKELAAAEDEKRLHPAPLSAEEIYQKYHDAAVEISMVWRAFDKDSGRPIYHKVVHFKDKILPCYVQLPNGDIVRWLTTEDQDHINHLVGGAGQGSGFVVSSNGFIMTNKHVAAGWKIPFAAYSSDYEQGVGLLFPKLGDTRHVKIMDLSDPDIRQALNRWVPGADMTVIFEPTSPKIVAGGRNQVTGQNESLSVRFPGNTEQIDAKLVTASDQADAAEIKIDTQQNLRTVTMAPDSDVRNGEAVTVLGFPGFSTAIHALRTTVENGRLDKRDDVVPQPTVTEGNVSLLSTGPKQVGDVVTVGEMGEVYQLTVPTSHGNSGGPVFDSRGHVIALFTYGDPRRETNTFAVPIHYARDLMQIQAAP